VLAPVLSASNIRAIRRIARVLRATGGDRRRRESGFRAPAAPC